MKPGLVDYLKCPYDDHRPLEVYPFEEEKSGWGREVKRGILFCGACGRHYPVRDSIPSILSDDLRGEGGIEENDWKSLPPGVVSALRRRESGSALKGEGFEDRLSEMKKRDEESGIYDTLYPRESSLAELELYLRALEPGIGDRVLDAGCGTGRVTVELLPRCAEVVGVDFSMQSLRFLLNRVEPPLRARLHLVQADLSLLPLREQRFDKGVSSSVLCFLPTESLRRRAVGEIRNALKPRGLFVASVYNYSLLKRLLGFFRLSTSGKKEGYHSGGRIRYFNFDEDEFRALLSSGFEVLCIVGSDHRLPVVGRIHPAFSRWIDRVFTGGRVSIPLFAREMTATCRRP
jgi:SAM-dependent methyltransferase/uncharacterized protein YbaR (Trm112 family)